jgi:prepilin-type N-terminal cleavage/methylation domain-containing protein
MHFPVAQAGFTLVEMLVAMGLAGIVATMAFTFFNTSLSQYVALQAEGSSFTDVAAQSQRLASVLRGVTDITAASATDLDCYAYFAPSDQYVSDIHYYKSADGKKLLADVTRMTSNPPEGTPISGSLQTFTVISNYYQVPGVDLFTYLDASGNTLTLPLSDLRTIKGIQVALSAQGNQQVQNSSQTITLQVSLRNRKVNL